MVCQSFAFVIVHELWRSWGSSLQGSAFAAGGEATHPHPWTGGKAMGVTFGLNCISLTAWAINVGPTDTGEHARVWVQHDEKDAGKLSRTVADLLLPQQPRKSPDELQSLRTTEPWWLCPSSCMSSCPVHCLVRIQQGTMQVSLANLNITMMWHILLKLGGKVYT